MDVGFDWGWLVVKGNFTWPSVPTWLSMLAASLLAYWTFNPEQFKRDIWDCYCRYLMRLWNRLKEMVGWRVVVRNTEDLHAAIEKKGGRFRELVLAGTRVDTFQFPADTAVTIDHLVICQGTIVQVPGSEIVIGKGK